MRNPQSVVESIALKEMNLMDTQIIATYCLCDDVLKGFGHWEDPQSQMTDAEVLTSGVVAALHFGGNLSRACQMLGEQGYIPKMLGKSRFNRRLHRVAEQVGVLFGVLGELWKAWNTDSTYVLDSFPLLVCENCRIRRCHLCQGEEWRGYQASKKRYFYGVRLHFLVTGQGEPVEFFLTPGSVNDTTALKMYHLDLPEGSKVIGDKAFNDYRYEDLLKEANMTLLPLRKINSKRPYPPWQAYWLGVQRKVVETAGSLIERLLPKHIHAVTFRGFELKVALFVLASSISLLC